MTKILMVQGDGDDLLAIRQLAIEAGLATYWVREKAKAIPSKLTRHSHGKLPASETRIGKLILETMRQNPMRYWTCEELGIELEARGYSGRSVSPTLTYLCREGLLNRPEKGSAVLTAKGRGDWWAEASRR